MASFLCDALQLLGALGVVWGLILLVVTSADHEGDA